MYDASCSSSTIISPKFLNGKNNEDLAPITILILFFVIDCHISLFLLKLIFECQIAGSYPKKSLNLFLNCVVRNISGINIKACLFSSISFFILSKYTNVFPDPVTPNKTETLNLFPDLMRLFKAFCCSFKIYLIVFWFFF